VRVKGLVRTKCLPCAVNVAGLTPRCTAFKSRMPVCASTRAGVGSQAKPSGHERYSATTCGSCSRMVLSSQEGWPPRHATFATYHQAFRPHLRSPPKLRQAVQVVVPETSMWQPGIGPWYPTYACGRTVQHCQALPTGSPSSRDTANLLDSDLSIIPSQIYGSKFVSWERVFGWANIHSACGGRLLTHDCIRWCKMPAETPGSVQHQACLLDGRWH